MTETSHDGTRPGIFDGLKVIDFTWAAAGPILTKQLADNGALVVKVESHTHPDSVRLGGPFKDATPGINRSGFFADFNSSKKSLGVDMGSEAGRELVARMVPWADVIADNFRPGVLARWGLGHDVLSELNPRAILISSSLYGEDGPWATLAGFGAQGAAASGIHGLTGWPDLPPALPKGAYTDSVSPRFGMAALAAALVHRERTGRGQRIELSQVETTVSLLAPHLLQAQLTGHAPQRMGNRAPGSWLHAVLPCAGEDEWIAVEARTEEEWRSLCVIVAAQDADALAALRGLAPRDQPDEAERLVGSLTRARDPSRLMKDLQAVGVPSGVVLKGSGLLADEHLRARGHFWALDHAEMGRLDYNGPAYRFEKTPSRLTSAAPLLGEHTDEVMREVLGMSDAEIARHREEGVLQ